MIDRKSFEGLRKIWLNTQDQDFQEKNKDIINYKIIFVFRSC